jgi:hypothetical protein
MTPEDLSEIARAGIPNVKGDGDDAEIGLQK